MEQQLQANINKLLKEVEQTCLCSNRQCQVEIVAATKTQSVQTIAQLCDCGICVSGENRVQEFLEKYGKVNTRWQFIGRLQTNKVKYIVDKVDLIQSVDSTKLAEEIDRRCREIQKVMPVLVEVNFGGEQQKGGISPSDIFDFVNKLGQYPNLSVQGIMTVMPIGAPQLLYEQAYDLFKQLQSKNNDEKIKILSMGMSDDYLLAVKCGSNMIRVGRALFGERK